MRIDVVTPFPEMIRGFFEESMLRRAQEKGAAEITVWDLRDFTTDKHRTVDDYPYGGGAGMVMKPEPFFRAMDQIRVASHSGNPRVIFPTPQGVRYTQKMAQTLSEEEHLVFLCGHYRGVDERVIEALVTDEVSIGDYILTGGELASAAMIDSVIRLLPGVLGDFDSAQGDSFSCGGLDYPHYTRPEEYKGLRVPEVLLSGHHANVAVWRKEQSLKRTQERRPDLLGKASNHARTDQD